MNLSKEWYALYTKRGSEKKVTARLERRGIAYYCPLNLVASENGKLQYAPLFPSLVFVHVTANERSTLTSIADVINIVYRLQHFAVFSDEEIESIRLFLKKHETVQVEKISFQHLQAVNSITSTMHVCDDKESLLTGNDVLDLPALGYRLMASYKSYSTVKLIRKTPTGIYKTANNLAWVFGLKANSRL
ncbi:MAG: UpxY family transcription antiterminator [Chitinophagaceae bacterium]